jgi:transcriptional regulator of aroF, aroG, tyrA and aromatic amino acid transport
MIQLAEKGTLFLDEVDTLPMSMQAKLLRFLQEREIWLIGGETSIPVDVRIICACNHDLSKLVDMGTFRQDLYYRINVINISAAALRDRRSDIPELVNSFIDELNIEMGNNTESLKIHSIEKDVLKMLMDYDWPGNIRELKNVIERAMNRCKGNVLQWEDFPDFDRWVSQGHTLNATLPDTALTLKDLHRRTEAAAIQNLLDNDKLSVSDAAIRLGISRQMLYRKIKDYGIRLS